MVQSTNELTHDPSTYPLKQEPSGEISVLKQLRRMKEAKLKSIDQMNRFKAQTSYRRPKTQEMKIRVKPRSNLKQQRVQQLSMKMGLSSNVMEGEQIGIIAAEQNVTQDTKQTIAEDQNTETKLNACQVLETANFRVYSDSPSKEDSVVIPVNFLRPDDSMVSIPTVGKVR